MIYENTKTITLRPISETEIANFDLATRDGRESLTDRIKDDIDDYCLQAYDDGFRSHLGASLIGQECERFLWFIFRWMAREKFDARMLRLLTRGHIEEPRFIEYLEGIGIKVQQIDPSTNKQWRISDCGGHFGGSCDGIATLPERYGKLAGTQILAEFKTCGTGAKFNELEQNGFVTAKPVHWSQVCVYGFKLALQHVLYKSVNKNDDSLHIEFVALDWSHGQSMIAKANNIITTQNPPARLSENPSFFKCKWCPVVNLCHHLPVGGQMIAPARNCRSCVNAQPIPDAQWHCNKWNATIPADYIATGCDAWTPLPY